MPQSCTVCRNPERSSIDIALIEDQPLRDIAKRFRTTPASLHRHRQHLPLELAKAKQAEDVAQATTLLDRVESLIPRLQMVAEQAQEDRAWSAATSAIRELRGCLTLLAQLRGELRPETRTSISVSLALQQIRTVAKTASPDQFVELLQFTRELLDNASEEQFAAVARASGVDLPPS